MVMPFTLTAKDAEAVTEARQQMYDCVMAVRSAIRSENLEGGVEIILGGMAGNLRTLMLGADQTLATLRNPSTGFLSGAPAGRQVGGALNAFVKGFLKVADKLSDEASKSCLAVIKACQGPTAVYLVFPLPPFNVDEYQDAKFPFLVECPAKPKDFLIGDLEQVFSDNKKASQLPSLGSSGETGPRFYFGGDHKDTLEGLSQDIESIHTMFSGLPSDAPQDEETLANLQALAENRRLPKSFARFDDPALMLVVKDSANSDHDFKTFFKLGVADEVTGHTLSLFPSAASPDKDTPDRNRGMMLLRELSSANEENWSKAKSDLMASLVATKEIVENSIAA